MSVFRTLASTENPLFSQRSISLAASASMSRCMRNQRTTRRHTFSVSVARSAWLIGRAGNCLRQAACPQEGRRPATGWHEDAVGRARMEMHMVIERGSEAVQKGDGTESRASRARPVTVTGRARRSTKQSLDLFDEDPREGCYRAWAVSEKAAQSLRERDHPLPHGRSQGREGQCGTARPRPPSPERLTPEAAA
jgi:hypothetical protein